MTYGAELTIPIYLTEGAKFCTKLGACAHALKSAVPSRAKIEGEHKAGVVKYHQKHAKTAEEINLPNALRCGLVLKIGKYALFFGRGFSDFHAFRHGFSGSFNCFS